MSEPILFREVKLEGGWLMIKPERSDIGKAMALVRNHKNRLYNLEVKQFRRKRSLDANGFAWSLIHEIAAEVRDTPENVYREAVRGIGGVSEVVCIKQEAVDAWKRLFIGDHIGRQITEQPSKLPGCVTLICTYGSSDYDTRQMSQLIDNLIQDAHALGIQTPEDERINTLLEEWDAQTDKSNADQ